MSDLSEAVIIAKHGVEKAQQRQKMYYDQGHKD